MATTTVLGELRRAIRVRHYSRRTEGTYVHWVRRLLRFTQPTSIDQITDEAVGRYLAHLAEQHRVSAATQNQAAAALRFLFVAVLERTPPKRRWIRANESRPVPVVLSAAEVRAVIGAMRDSHRLLGLLM